MAQIVEAEIATVLPQPPGTAPNYNKNNPLWHVIDAVAGLELQADREHYLGEHLEHLLPIAALAFYGPSGNDFEVRDPRLQDNKNDFQKQNIYELRLTGLQLARGYARAGDWTGSFLHLSYRPVPGSPLLEADGTYRADHVLIFLQVGEASTGADLLTVPFDPKTGLYSLEVWAFPGGDLRERLGDKGRAAVDRGAVVARPDLVRGDLAAFEGPDYDALRDQARAQNGAVTPFDLAPDHTMHPLRPLRLELALTDPTRTRWEPGGGANHVFAFCMVRRGWRHYLAVGQSANPHGGVGSLEFRNLFSNYFDHEARRRAAFGPGVLPELGRDLEPWNIDADGAKPPREDRETFLAVDYMDLHVLRPNSVIGIHRHRDNQEVFLVLEGRSLMITGDWLQPDDRARAFEVRTLLPGDLALIKGGEVHALANTLDENVLLFMFGGYD